MTFLAIRKALLAKPKKMRGWIFCAGLGLTILLALLAVYRPVFFRFLDYKVYDTILRSNSSAGSPGHRQNLSLLTLMRRALPVSANGRGPVTASGFFLRKSKNLVPQASALT